MSADSVHQGIEDQMHKLPGGNVYDFNDMCDVFRQSNSGNVEVKSTAARLELLNWALKNGPVDNSNRIKKPVSNVDAIIYTETVNKNDDGEFVDSLRKKELLMRLAVIVRKLQLVNFQKHYRRWKLV